MFEDKNLEVRRQAILTFDAVLKSTDLINKAENSRLMESVVVPTLYNETEPNPEYIKIMDAGALKLRVDDHLPLRRAAFDTLATITRLCGYRLNMRDFFEYTMQGILDAEEVIVMRTWEMYYQITRDPSLKMSLRELGSGTSRKPIDLTGGTIKDKSECKTMTMDKILLQFVKKKMGTLKGAQSTETEQAREVVKKALMTVFTMVEIPGMEQCRDFVHLVDRIKKTKGIAKEIQEANKALAA